MLVYILIMSTMLVEFCNFLQKETNDGFHSNMLMPSCSCLIGGKSVTVWNIIDYVLNASDSVKAVFQLAWSTEHIEHALYRDYVRDFLKAATPSDDLIDAVNQIRSIISSGQKVTHVKFGKLASDSTCVSITKVPINFTSMYPNATSVKLVSNLPYTADDLKYLPDCVTTIECITFVGKINDAITDVSVSDSKDIILHDNVESFKTYILYENFRNNIPKKLKHLNVTFGGYNNLIDVDVIEKLPRDMETIIGPINWNGKLFKEFKSLSKVSLGLRYNNVDVWYLENLPSTIEIIYLNVQVNMTQYHERTFKMLPKSLTQIFVCGWKKIQLGGRASSTAADFRKHVYEDRSEYDDYSEDDYNVYNGYFN